LSENDQKLTQALARSLDIFAYRTPQCGSVAHMALIAAIESVFDVMMDAEDVIAAWLDNLPQRGVDRIVAVGSALNLETVWDEVDLLDAFTRKISVSATSTN
jgi:hypothetical protein